VLSVRTSFVYSLRETHAVNKQTNKQKKIFVNMSRDLDREEDLHFCPAILI